MKKCSNKEIMNDLNLADAKLLQKISSELLRHDETQSLYEKITDAAMLIMKAQFASMQLLHTGGNAHKLQLLAFRGFSSQAAKFWENIDADSGSTTCSESIRTGTRTIVGDVEQCDFMKGTSDLDCYLQTGIHAVQSTPLYTRRGKMIGIISTHWDKPHEPSENDLALLDVLARQAADLIEHNLSVEELKASEEKYRSLFDNLNDGFFLAEIILDSSGKPADYQYLAVNKETSRFVGLRPDEMIGRTWKQLFNYPCLHLEEMSKVALEGKPMKLVNYLPEFNLYYQLSMYSPRHGQFACHIQDMTGKAKVESELRAQQEKMLSAEKEKNEALKKAIDMKDDFLSLISHEFKTPLTVMISAIQAMELLCRNELSQRARGFLKTIQQSANRQLKLVNNLLDITRINSGHIKVNISNTDIVHLSAVITESIKVYTDLKGISLKFVTSLNKKIIAIDEEKFERILLNLLSNAAKFTPRGRSITVRVSTKTRRGRAMVCIQVIDEGIGIPRDKQAIIFERFGQVDSSLTRQAEGTGIGLFLVKLFVDLLDGEISVKSSLGEGSTFTVLLPVKKAGENAGSSVQKDMMDDRLIRATTIEFSDVYFN